MGKKRKKADEFLANDEFNTDEDFPEYIQVTDVLDLHGFFPEQVAEIVGEFIRSALELKLYRVRIIHGKGRSKMKWTVHQELKKHKNVSRFGDASPDSGGWGATIVELKSN